MPKKTTTTPIDLGQLQAKFESDQRVLKGAEKKLKQAQEARDSARARATASQQALSDATRAVLG